MKPFRYRFRAALDDALERERAAALAVARADAALERERSLLAALEARAGDVRQRIGAGRMGSAAEFAELDRRLVTLAANGVRLAERIAHCRSAVARERAQLATFAQRRSALERHRERCRAAYEAALELSENAAFDEANNLGAARVRRESNARTALS